MHAAQSGLDAEWQRRVDALDQEPILLPALGYKLLRFALIGFVFAFAGALIAARTTLLIVGLGFAAFGVLTTLALFVGMARPPALRLTVVGFETIALRSTFSRSWDEIERFHLRKQARAPTWAAYTLKGRPQSAKQNLNRGLGGADGVFANIYELEPADMVALLETARNRWSSTA